MILFILIAAHFLADFTFQPSVLAKSKTESIGFLLIHGLIYAVVMAAAGFTVVYAKAMLLPFAIIVLSHLVLDFLRIRIDTKYKNATVRFWSFIFDQVIHVAVLAVVYFGFKLGEFKLLWFEASLYWWYMTDLIACVLIFVVIWDTASVFIRKLFSYLSGTLEEDYIEDEPRTGSLIGKLERLIIAVLVIFNQIGGIGFVLTAKSIARFKQFEEQGFAEKYLVGTLASASIAIIVSLMLRSFM